MALSAPVRAYRVRWQETETPRQASAVVDHDTRRITVTTPGGEPFTVDVVAARAVSMILADAVYGALQPDGPLLALEVDNGHGWTDLREAR